MEENDKTENKPKNKDWEELQKWQKKQDEATVRKFGFDVNQEKLKERTKIMAIISQLFNRTIKTQKAILVIIVIIIFILAWVFISIKFLEFREVIPNLDKPQETINEFKNFIGE